VIHVILDFSYFILLFIQANEEQHTTILFFFSLSRLMYPTTLFRTFILGPTKQFYTPKTMIPATGNNWNFTETGRKEAEKSLDPAGNVRKMMRNGSSIPIGKFSDFFR
jgi:hypothetical protein